MSNIGNLCLLFFINQITRWQHGHSIDMECHILLVLLSLVLLQRHLALTKPVKEGQYNEFIIIVIYYLYNCAVWIYCKTINVCKLLLFRVAGVVCLEC